jgi:hypothetical protein
MVVFPILALGKGPVIVSDESRGGNIDLGCQMRGVALAARALT